MPHAQCVPAGKASAAPRESSPEHLSVPPPGYRGSPGRRPTRSLKATPTPGCRSRTRRRLIRTYPATFKLDRVWPAVVTDGLAELRSPGPMSRSDPVISALAEDWTYRASPPPTHGPPTNPTPARTRGRLPSIGLACLAHHLHNHRSASSATTARAPATRTLTSPPARVPPDLELLGLLESCCLAPTSGTGGRRQHLKMS
jgi:hypothetical protein